MSHKHCGYQGPSLLYKNTPDLSIVGRSGQCNTPKYQCFHAAQPAHVALYLQHLLETSEANTAVDDAVNALAWVNELGGLPSPTSHPTVRAMQESAHHIKGRPKVKKEPATPQLLQKMVSTLAQESA